MCSNVFVRVFTWRLQQCLGLRPFHTSLNNPLLEPLHSCCTAQFIMAEWLTLMERYLVCQGLDRLRLPQHVDLACSAIYVSTLQCALSPSRSLLAHHGLNQELIGIEIAGIAAVLLWHSPCYRPLLQALVAGLRVHSLVCSLPVAITARTSRPQPGADRDRNSRYRGSIVMVFALLQALVKACL
jgi:hypothetical protein